MSHFFLPGQKEVGHRVIGNGHWRTRILKESRFFSSFGKFTIQYNLSHSNHQEEFMTIASKLHKFINDNNILTKPTQQINQYFANHPEAQKAALIFNHIFRAAAMAGFMMVLPFSFPVSAGLCAAGSLFYRLTVENNCAYKFALPAFAGASSALLGKTALLKLIHGVAFFSLEALSKTFVALIPLSLYAAYVALTVSHEVNHRHCHLRLNSHLA